MSTIVFGNMEKTCELNNSDKVYMGGWAIVKMAHYGDLANKE